MFPGDQLRQFPRLSEGLELHRLHLSERMARGKVSGQPWISPTAYQHMRPTTHADW